MSRAETQAGEATDAAPAPFTMIGAGPGMVCEGDVCEIQPVTE